MSASELVAKPQSRNAITLERLGNAWLRDPERGMAFVQGMTAWLTSYSNPNTRRSNSYSVLEFFDWYEARRGRIPVPHEVTREDANAFTQWLHTRTFGLEEIRLRRDPERLVDSKIYSYVRNRPGAGYEAIRASLLGDSDVPKVRTADGAVALALEADNAWNLDVLLARMVEQKLLTREPTMAEIRARGVIEGVDWSRAGIDFRPPPNIYRYFPDRHTDAVGEDRASTVLRRIATLSSLWRWWAERGENTDDKPAPLRFNIWAPLVQDEAELAPSRQKIYRQSHTPTLENWRALVGTTDSKSLDDIRDRAILMLLFWQGLRVQELCSLQRKSRVVIDGQQCIRVRRKNGRVQHLVLEPEAAQALELLDQKLMELAEAQESRERSAAERYEMSTGRQAEAKRIPRWRRVLENPESPLIPVLRRWGTNADDTGEERGLTRQAVAMMLRRRAAMPSNPEDPTSPPVVPEADWPKIHPHGFRHLAAKEARRAGADVATIQASLGHESLATTSRYVEEHELARTRLFAGVRRDEPVQAVVAAPVVPAMPPPARRKAKAIAIEAVVPAVVEVVEAKPPRGPRVLSRRPRTSLSCAPIASVGLGSPDYAYQDQCWGDVEKDVYGAAGRVRIHGTAFAPAPKFEGDPLAYAFVGKSSRLVWWTGPSNSLVKSMPVLSPLQMMAKDGPKGVRGQLADLWWDWMHSSGEEAGPTSAAALVQWVDTALSVAGYMRTRADEDGATFLRFDEDDVLVDVPGEVCRVARNYREHRADKVAAWFKEFAREFRVPLRSENLVDDRPMVPMSELKPGDTKRWGIPEWYLDPDPVKSLPDDERKTLLALIQALTGQAVTDRAPRFPGGASRANVRDLLFMMAEYDALADQLAGGTFSGELTASQLRGGVGVLDKEERKAVLDAMRVYGGEIDKKLASFGTKGRAYAERVKARREATYQKQQRAAMGLEEDPRTARYSFYGSVLREAIGEEGMADPVVQVLVKSEGSGPLEDHVALLRVDPKAGTIVSSPEYAKAIAQSFGTHSDCVGRRIARHLWERLKTSARPLERIDELDRTITNMAAYRIPCPEALEQELQARIPESLQTIEAFNRDWAKVEEEMLSRPGWERMAEIESLVGGYSEEASREFARELRQATPNPPRKQRFLMNPIDFMFAASLLG